MNAPAAISHHQPGCRAHHCHARGCDKHVKPQHLMCAAHWRLVPAELQQAVYATYRDGQCNGNPIPSRDWQIAAERAINAVAVKEHQPVRHFLLGVDLRHDPPCERPERVTYDVGGIDAFEDAEELRDRRNVGLPIPRHR